MHNRMIMIALRTLFLGLSCLIATGCMSLHRESGSGFESLDQAVDWLDGHARSAGSLRVTRAQCYVKSMDAEGRCHEIQFSLKMWFVPPHDVYLHGQAAPGPSGQLWMGTNDREFWIGVKPELNTYWWGRWQDLQGRTLLITPALAMEILGLVQPDRDRMWQFRKEGRSDVLFLDDTASGVHKTVRIDHREKRVREIRYAGPHETVTVYYDRYWRLTPDFAVPRKMTVHHQVDGQELDSIRISVASVTTADFDQKRRDYMFTRKEPRGFDRVIQLPVSGQTSALETH